MSESTVKAILHLEVLGKSAVSWAVFLVSPAPRSVEDKPPALLLVSFVVNAVVLMNLVKACFFFFLIDFCFVCLSAISSGKFTQCLTSARNVSPVT